MNDIDPMIIRAAQQIADKDMAVRCQMCDFLQARGWEMQKGIWRKTFPDKTKRGVQSTRVAFRIECLRLGIQWKL